MFEQLPPEKGLAASATPFLVVLQFCDTSGGEGVCVKVGARV